MPKRILKGVVVSDKADKTITVLVERSSKKYMTHDEDNKFKVGDLVQIRECKPLSKSKTWEVIND